MRRIFMMPVISLIRMLRQLHKSPLFNVLLVLVIFGFFFWPYIGTPNASKRPLIMDNLIVKEKGSGCKMPVLSTNDPVMMGFYRDVPNNVTCDDVDWVKCNFSKCYVVKEILEQKTDIICVYKDIIYVNDNNYYMGDAVNMYGDDVYVLNRSDQVSVSCSGHDKNGFGIIRSRWSGYTAGYRPISTDNSPNDNYNILFLMFDSMSRLNFIRRLPKTYKYLTEELGAVVLKSYNIVGDATPAALIPILTGHFETEMPNARQDVSRTYINLSYYIFSSLKERGYRTAYYEDLAWLGTFQYRYNGFSESPTDHYLFPFFMGMTKLRFRDHSNVYSDPNSVLNKWAHKIGLSDPKCIGSVPVHKFLLDYTTQLFAKQGKKFCVTFSGGLSHDDLSLVSVADEDLVKFLDQFRNDGRLENTALFLMSDHGARFFAIRNTYQGKLEERLPFVSVILPGKLKRERPEALSNLMSNTETLTSPYDIHTTILDILNMNELRNKYKVPGADLERGLSLLKEIPKSRSCPEAGIMPYWCACATWRNVSQTSPIYKQIAMILADYINEVTEKVRSLCVRRELISIEYVHYSTHIMSHSEANNDGHYNRSAPYYYLTKIIMSPRNAIYEGSMQYFGDKLNYKISDRDISRVNAYGDDPKCVFNTHPHLRKFCYCKNTDLITKNNN